MKTIVSISSLLLFFSVSYAQPTEPRLEIFGGYSTQKIDTEQFEEFSRFAGLTQAQMQTNFNASASQLHQAFDDSYRAARRLDGVNASITYYFHGRLGLTGDFAYHTKGSSHATPNNPVFFEDFTRSERNSFTVLAGPQVKFRRQSRVQPFVRLLAGVTKQENQSSQFFNNPGSSGQPIETRRLEDDFSAFTVGGGGGIDLELNQRWAIRLVQVDYLAAFPRNRTAVLSSNGVSLGVTSFEGSRRDTLRFSFGVVLRW